MTGLAAQVTVALERSILPSVIASEAVTTASPGTGMGADRNGPPAGLLG